MEVRDFVMGVIGLFGTILGWLLHVVWNSVDTLRKDHQTFQTYIADTYARKNDVQSMAENIMTFLRRIEDKLDGKVDK
jgi:hypothetical protein